MKFLSKKNKAHPPSLLLPLLLLALALSSPSLPAAAAFVPASSCYYSSHPAAATAAAGSAARWRPDPPRAAAGGAPPAEGPSPSTGQQQQPPPRVEEKEEEEALMDLFYREADAIFDAIDANGDGEISNDELELYLERKGCPSDSIRMLFTALDKNADGAVSREEMRYAFSNYEISALYRAFGLGDKIVSESIDDALEGSNTNGGDGDGGEYHDEAVSEIRSDAMLESGKHSPEMLTKLADMIFDMIDVDGSGEIDLLELRMHFAQYEQDQHQGGPGTSSPVIRNVGQASIASANSILRALDINSDGLISREEMRKGFREYDPRALSGALGLQVSRTVET